MKCKTRFRTAYAQAVRAHQLLEAVHTLIQNAEYNLIRAVDPNNQIIEYTGPAETVFTLTQDVNLTIEEMMGHDLQEIINNLYLVGKRNGWLPSRKRKPQRGEPQLTYIGEDNPEEPSPEEQNEVLEALSQAAEDMVEQQELAFRKSRDDPHG